MKKSKILKSAQMVPRGWGWVVWHVRARFKEFGAPQPQFPHAFPPPYPPQRTSPPRAPRRRAMRGLGRFDDPCEPREGSPHYAHRAPVFAQQPIFSVNPMGATPSHIHARPGSRRRRRCPGACCTTSSSASTSITRRRASAFEEKDQKDQEKTRPGSPKSRTR